MTTNNHADRRAKSGTSGPGGSSPDEARSDQSGAAGPQGAPSIQLTPLEARMALFALSNLQDDLSSTCLTGPEKAAFWRALHKVNAIGYGGQS